jgi:hypothetical protein
MKFFLKLQRQFKQHTQTQSEVIVTGAQLKMQKIKVAISIFTI